MLRLRRAFEPIGRSYREFRQHFPQPGWVEHDLAELWAVTHAVAGEALADAGDVRPGELAAVAIANQRETVCVWDPPPASPCIARSSGRTVAPRRCASSCAPTGTSRSIRARTGLVLDPYFSATKIAWLLEHVPGLPDARP